MTTHWFATAPPVPRTTRPVTWVRWAASGVAAHRAAATARAALRNELAEIFRIEVLEVGLERVRVEGAGAGIAHGIGGLDGRVLEEPVLGEDRGLEPQDRKSTRLNSSHP